MDSCRTSQGPSQPPMHAEMGTVLHGFKTFTLWEGEGDAQSSLPSLAYENTSSLKFISTLLMSWCISMPGNIGQRLAHPAPKSLHCPQQGREMQNRGVLSSAQQHPGAPRGGNAAGTKLASAHFRPGCDSLREKKGNREIKRPQMLRV